MARELPIFKELENNKVHAARYTKHHLSFFIYKDLVIFLETQQLCYNPTGKLQSLKTFQ